MIYYLFYRVYKRTFAIMALAKSVGGFFCPKTAHFLVCEPIPAQWQEKKSLFYCYFCSTGYLNFWSWESLLFRAGASQKLRNNPFVICLLVCGGSGWVCVFILYLIYTKPNTLLFSMTIICDKKNQTFGSHTKINRGKCIRNMINCRMYVRSIYSPKGKSSNS